MKRWWIWLIALLLLVGGFCLIQNSRGYHLEWSGANCRFIWVDDEGKP